MDEHQIEDVAHRLDVVTSQMAVVTAAAEAAPSMLKWMKGFVGGACALAAWATMMQARQISIEKEQSAAHAHVTSNESRIRAVETLPASQNATTNAELRAINATLERINQKMP